MILPCGQAVFVHHALGKALTGKFLCIRALQFFTIHGMDAYYYLTPKCNPITASKRYPLEN